MNRNVVIDVGHGRAGSNISKVLCGEGGTKQKASCGKTDRRNSHKKYLWSDWRVGQVQR